MSATPIKTIEWKPDHKGQLVPGMIRLVDQTRLPGELILMETRDLRQVWTAIKTLQVRGAPAIGIAAAMGLVAVLEGEGRRERLLAAVEDYAGAIAAARPTAVNLAWAMERMRRCAHATQGSPAAILTALRAEAQAIWDEDRAMCLKIAEHGQQLLTRGVDAAARHSRLGSRGSRPAAHGCGVLTHCNTGALATGGIGTALGIVHLAAGRGVKLHVYVDETRPLLQGSRLTAWELGKAGIPHTILPDAAAGALMAAGQVDIVLVGADRIARNGDVANKVGTYALAVLAQHHGIPFYSVAPSSTFDPACASGAEIPIEHRSAEEITRPFGVAVAPAGSAVLNPAFDVTPAELVTGYVTEKGIVKPPFE